MSLHTVTSTADYHAAINLRIGCVSLEQQKKANQQQEVMDTS